MQQLAERFEVLEALHDGGEAQVLIARPLRVPSSKVVLKWYKRGSPHRLPELLALRALGIPGVVRLLETLVIDGRVCLVLDYIEGEPFPGASCRTPWATLGPVVHAVLEILAQVHATGVVHGDLHPANVIVDPRQQPWLIDFGGAGGAAIDRGSEEQFWGTPPFAAPELSIRNHRSPASDLYSLGVMVWQALVGAVIRDVDGRGPDPSGVLRGEAVSAGELVDLPGEVASWLHCLLQANPGDRPQTALAALGLLERAWHHPCVEPLLPSGEGPLSHASLRPLFVGNDRIVHAVEDVVEELMERTAGRREAVSAELLAWERRDLIQREGDRYRVRRGSVEVLRAMGGRRLALPRECPEVDSLGEPFAAVLRGVALAWPNSRAEELVHLHLARADSVDVVVRALEDGGFLERLPGGRLRDRTGGRCLSGWTSNQRAKRHAVLADSLDPGTPGRLRHLLASDRREAAAEEARVLAERALARGQVTEALGLLESAVGWLRVAGVSASPSLLRALVMATLASERLGDRARVAGKLPASMQSPALLLLHVVEPARSAEPAEVLKALEKLDTSEDQELELARITEVIRFANSLGCRTLREKLDELRPWVRSTGARATGRFLGWMGHLSYLQSSFGESAGFHLSAALVKSMESEHVASLTMAASSLIEAGDVGRALLVAEEARAKAAAIRHLHYEARAERTVRSCLYREAVNQGVRGPDPDLVFLEALEEADAQWMLPISLITEAGCCWRWGDPSQGAALADRVARAPGSAGLRSHELLAWGLGSACRLEALSAEERREAGLVDAAQRGQLLLACRSEALPAIALQALALALPGAGGEALALGELLADRASTFNPKLCREVLSPAEALLRLNLDHTHGSSPQGSQ